MLPEDRADRHRVSGVAMATIAGTCDSITYTGGVSGGRGARRWGVEACRSYRSIAEMQKGAKGLLCIVIRTYLSLTDPLRLRKVPIT